MLEDDGGQQRRNRGDFPRAAGQIRDAANIRPGRGGQGAGDRADRWRERYWQGAGGARHPSGRVESRRPFVAVNCPAIPRCPIKALLQQTRLLERRRASIISACFRAADGGTLLLDEVTEMNLETQSKLLRLSPGALGCGAGGSVAEGCAVQCAGDSLDRIAQPGRQLEWAGCGRFSLSAAGQRDRDSPAARAFRGHTGYPPADFINFNPQSGPLVPVTGIAQDAMAALLRYSSARQRARTLQCHRGRGYLRAQTARLRLKDCRKTYGERGGRADRGRRSTQRRPPARCAELHQCIFKTFEETERELIRTGFADGRPQQDLRGRAAPRFRARSSTPGWPVRAPEPGPACCFRALNRLHSLARPARALLIRRPTFCPAAPRCNWCSPTVIVFLLMLKTCMRLISASGSPVHLSIGVVAPVLAVLVGSGCALGTDCWMK